MMSKHKLARQERVQQLDEYYKETRKEWLENARGTELKKYDDIFLYWRENKLHQEEFTIVESKLNPPPYINGYDKDVYDRIVKRFNIEGLQQSFL